MRLGLTSAEDLRATFRAKRRGAPKMRTVLDDLGTGAVGAPARELYALLEGAGLPLPVLEYPVRRADGRMAYIDGAYPDERIAIEIDDFDTHADPAAMDAERERQAELTMVLPGWRWIRFTPRQIRRRPTWVVEIIAVALGLDAVRRATS